jgi:Abnormal spindle-like microcephaly-assoc'd, ASPM-SPD-2-Hydin
MRSKLLFALCSCCGIAVVASCGGGAQPPARNMGPADLVLTPGQIDFRTQIIATPSAPAIATLKNSGGAVLTLSSISVSGNAVADFASDTTACGATLLPDEACAVAIAFTPGQLGPRTASLDIATGSATSLRSVPISGVGVTFGPNATVSAQGLGFSNQNVGTTSSAQSVTLTNYGSAPLAITSVAASSDFSEQDNCVTTLAPTASCTINVTFTPTNSGAVSGAITISDDASDSPQTVALDGSTGALQCVLYGRPCSPTSKCCGGAKCQFWGGSTRGGYSCR